MLKNELSWSFWQTNHSSSVNGRGTMLNKLSLFTVAYPGIFSGGGSTNSVEDREKRVRGSTQFANE
jgi:hypothetical protein